MCKRLQGVFLGWVHRNPLPLGTNGWEILQSLKMWAENAKVLSQILRKTSIFGPNGSEGHRISLFRIKNPKTSLISPKYNFGDIREICGFLFWKKKILRPSESFGLKNLFCVPLHSQLTKRVLYFIKSLLEFLKHLLHSFWS